MIVPSDFDWQDNDNTALVLREQPATAVYTNVKGAIVLRQEKAWSEDEDTVIIIQPEHAPAIAAAILREVGQIAPDTPRQTDRTAAERQRRHRAKRRNGVTARYGRDTTPELELE